MTDKKAKRIFDSREFSQGWSFDKDSGKLTIKTTKYEMTFDGQDLQQLLQELSKLKQVISEEPQQEYQGQYLVSNKSKLAHVILTQESMAAFMSASDNLSDKKYLQELHDKRFHKQDIPISSRNLNDWIHVQKLLPDDRTTTEQWHTFSKMDIAYIYVLKACREFGISLRFLHNAKESLLTKIPQSKFCLLEIAYTCFDKSKGREDIFLYMDSTGHCNIARIEDIVLMAKEKMINKNFILNLSEVWREI